MGIAVAGVGEGVGCGAVGGGCGRGLWWGGRGGGGRGGVKFFWHKKNCYQPFLTSAETKISVLLSASVEKFGVSRMRDIFKM